MDKHLMLAEAKGADSRMPMNRKAYLYIFDTLADWEIAFLTAELESGRYFKSLNEHIPIITVGATAETITTMGGLKLKPEMLVESMLIQENDLLMLPGGDTWLAEIHTPILEKARYCLDNKILLAAICGATTGLANRGLLNDRPHTSNDLGYLKAVCPHYAGEKYYRHELVVADGELITATGVAPLEFTYQVLKKLDVFAPATLEAWYGLYATKEARYFYALMESLKNRR
jgi:putative intracellular protease/amidase